MMILINVDTRTIRQSVAELTVPKHIFREFRRESANSRFYYIKHIELMYCRAYLYMYSIVKHVKYTFYRVSKVPLERINMIGSVKNGTFLGPLLRAPAYYLYRRDESFVGF